MGMRLGDYSKVFKEHGVTLEHFLTLAESDLDSMGIKEVKPHRIFGESRKKYIVAKASILSSIYW